VRARDLGPCYLRWIGTCSVRLIDVGRRSDQDDCVDLWLPFCIGTYLVDGGVDSDLASRKSCRDWVRGTAVSGSIRSPSCYIMSSDIIAACRLNMSCGFSFADVASYSSNRHVVRRGKAWASPICRFDNLRTCFTADSPGGHGTRYSCTVIVVPYHVFKGFLSLPGFTG